MKVRWEFFFEYEDLSFDRTYKYKVDISRELAEAHGLMVENGFEALVTIEKCEQETGSVRKLGTLKIELPGDNVQTKRLAYSLAYQITQQITFSQSKMSLSGGFVSNELLPETPEEIEQIGEKRFSMNLRVVEVPPEIPFNSKLLNQVTSSPLVIQFNEANEAKNPIDRFIGLFKILEDLYGGHPLKATFKGSADLIRLAIQHIEMEENEIVRPISQSELEKLFDDLVDTRHQCAHLRSADDFGITYGDARVQSVVEPLLIPLETLAYEAVKESLTVV